MDSTFILLLSLFVMVLARFDNEYYDFRTQTPKPTTVSPPYISPFLQQQQQLPFRYPSEYFAAHEAAITAAKQRNQNIYNSRINNQNQQKQQQQQPSFSYSSPLLQYQEHRIDQFPQARQDRYPVSLLTIDSRN